MIWLSSVSIDKKQKSIFFDEFYAQLTKSTSVANATRPAILDTANIRTDVLDWTNMLILWKQRFLDKQLIIKNGRSSKPCSWYIKTAKRL